MSKYNIISKYPKGNKPNVKYTIIYQVENNPEKYITSVLGIALPEYMNKVRFCYLEGTKTPLIKTKKEREDFIKEIYLFQKGSSYRKTHPIAMSALDILNNKKEKLLNELSLIENEINNKKQDDIKKYISKYREEIKSNEISNYINNLLKCLNNQSRYKVLPGYHFKYTFTNILFIYDSNLEKVVAKLKITSNNKWELKELLDEDIILLK